MGVQKTNDLLEKATWTLAIFVVALTMLSNLFISSPDVDNIEGLSPNIDRANEQNIIAKEVTPFVLSQINQLTKGKALLANIALIKNNAKLASKIALCF